MRITNLKRTATDKVTNHAAGKDAVGSNQKSRRFHIRNLTKVIALSLVFLTSTALSAQAHASLVSSNPADKATIQTMPKEISLTFDEDLMTLGGKQVSKFSVHDPKHHELKLTPFKVSGGTISADIKETGVSAGTYKIYYRVISADGHPVSGIISFNNKTASASNEIEVLKPVDWHEIKHWISHHKWHILETIAAIGFILAWAINRRRNRN
jgi:methionine-rich copper-binding protein CopC